MSPYRFILMPLLCLSLTFPAYAEELTKKVERLELEKSTLELKVDTLSSKVSQLEQLQEAHEVLLKRLISQLWDMQSKVDQRSLGQPPVNFKSGH